MEKQTSSGLCPIQSEQSSVSKRKPSISLQSCPFPPNLNPVKSWPAAATCSHPWLLFPSCHPPSKEAAVPVPHARKLHLLPTYCHYRGLGHLCHPLMMDRLLPDFLPAVHPLAHPFSSGAEVFLKGEVAKSGQSKLTASTDKSEACQYVTKFELLLGTPPPLLCCPPPEPMAQLFWILWSPSWALCSPPHWKACCPWTWTAGSIILFPPMLTFLP